jgi:glycosyltransferase involved in cell wall biosynthesis
MDKKITMLVFSLRHGGAEKVCLTLCNEFVKRNYETELWIVDNSESSLTKQLDKTIRVFALNKMHVRNTVIPLANLLLTRKPKRLLIFHIELAIVAILLKKLLFLKTIIIVRSINTLSQAFTYPKNIWEKYFAKNVIRRVLIYSDKLVAQSTGMKNDLINRFNIPPEKLITIHNPAHMISAVEINFPVDQVMENEFLYVGRLNPQKGLTNLLRAFKLAHEQNPNIQLTIVGEGSEKEKLLKLTDELCLTGNIRFEGFQPQTDKYYKRAKATLLTSNFEGFPNVLVESISLGTPVISFNCPSGPDDIIEPGLNGIIVPHLNVKKFAEAILAVANKEVLFNRQKIIDSSKRFSIDTILDQYEHMLINN